MKKILVLAVLIPCLSLSLFNGCNNVQEGVTEKTILGSERQLLDEIDKEEITDLFVKYFDAYKDHSVSTINKYLSNEMQYDESENGVVELFIDTVIDCELYSVDFEEVSITDENEIVLPVYYTLEYNENAIPAGARQIGKNNIGEIFTLKKQNGSYIIVDITINHDYYGSNNKFGE